MQFSPPHPLHHLAHRQPSERGGSYLQSDSGRIDQSSLPAPSQYVLRPAASFPPSEIGGEVSSCSSLQGLLPLIYRSLRCCESEVNLWRPSSASWRKSSSELDCLFSQITAPLGGGGSDPLSPCQKKKVRKRLVHLSKKELLQVEKEVFPLETHAHTASLTDQRFSGPAPLTLELEKGVEEEEGGGPAEKKQKFKKKTKKERKTVGTETDLRLLFFSSS